MLLRGCWMESNSSLSPFLNLVSHLPKLSPPGSLTRSPHPTGNQTPSSWYRASVCCRPATCWRGVFILSPFCCRSVTNAAKSFSPTPPSTTAEPVGRGSAMRAPLSPDRSQREAGGRRQLESVTPAFTAQKSQTVHIETLSDRPRTFSRPAFHPNPPASHTADSGSSQ